MARANKVSRQSNSTRNKRLRTWGAQYWLRTEDLRAVYPSLRGKRVLITGGGSGIGAGIVEGFARQGADVTFFDITNGDLEALAALAGARYVENDLVDVTGTQGRDCAPSSRSAEPSTSSSTMLRTTIATRSTRSQRIIGTIASA